MAEAGTLINWEYEGDTVTFRVAHGNRIEQVDIDLMGRMRGRDEWTSHEISGRLKDFGAHVRDLMEYRRRGPVTEDELAQIAAEVNSEAGIIFAAEEWLDELLPNTSA